jgi:hypothetical protein
VEVKIRSVSLKQHGLDCSTGSWAGSDRARSSLPPAIATTTSTSTSPPPQAETRVPVRQLLTCHNWLRQYPFVSMGSGYPDPKLDGATTTVSNKTPSL